VLCELLGFDSKLELLPLLQGLTEEVIVHEESEAKAKTARRKKRGGAFSKSNADDDEIEDKKEKGDEEGTIEQNERRWRRLLRIMWSGAAATALNNQLIQEYNSAMFKEKAEDLDRSWGPNVTFRDRAKDVDELCLCEVLSKVLPRFGFSGDVKGQQELKNLLEDCAKVDKNIKLQQQQIKRAIWAAFPSLVDSTRYMGAKTHVEEAKLDRAAANNAKNEEDEDQ